MGDRWLLTVHVEDTSAEIAHHVDHLLLGESIRSKLHQKVEEGSIRAKLTHNADLAASRSGLMDLGIVHHHDVIVSAQLPPDLHLISDECSLLLVLRIDLLQGVLLASEGVSDFVDETKAAL